MCATVSVPSVHRPTRLPSRAAAYAASHPGVAGADHDYVEDAILLSVTSLSNTESFEDVREHIV